MNPMLGEVLEIKVLRIAVGDLDLDPAIELVRALCRAPRSCLRPGHPPIGYRSDNIPDRLPPSLTEIENWRQPPSHHSAPAERLSRAVESGRRVPDAETEAAMGLEETFDILGLYRAWALPTRASAPAPNQDMIFSIAGEPILLCEREDLRIWCATC